MALGSDAIVTISTNQTLDIWSVSRVQLLQTFSNGAVLTRTFFFSPQAYVANYRILAALRGSKNARVLLAYGERRVNEDGSESIHTTVLSIISEWLKQQLVAAAANAKAAGNAPR